MARDEGWGRGRGKARRQTHRSQSHDQAAQCCTAWRFCSYFYFAGELTRPGASFMVPLEERLITQLIWQGVGRVGGKPARRPPLRHLRAPLLFQLVSVKRELIYSYPSGASLHINGGSSQIVSRFFLEENRFPICGSSFLNGMKWKRPGWKDCVHGDVGAI